MRYQNEQTSVISAEEAQSEILCRIREKQRMQARVFVALDGRCCAGKTTLAQRLGDALQTPVLHMDDFFLQPELRTAERLAEAGGNVDRERFLCEALEPLKRGVCARYRRWDCQAGAFEPSVTIEPPAVVLVEGAYSLHPALRAQYDMGVFLTIDETKQRERLLMRNGADGLQRFIDLWIPLEERYFALCKPMDVCELIVQA